MWGFSFDELAKRAQEEASKLAEQASSAAAGGGLFNLDAMQGSGGGTNNSGSSAAIISSSGSGGGFFTPIAESSSTSSFLGSEHQQRQRPYYTEPSKLTSLSETGHSGDGTITIRKSSSPSKSKPVARKLHIEDNDDTGDSMFDDFDTWGEGEEGKLLEAKEEYQSLVDNEKIKLEQEARLRSTAEEAEAAKLEAERVEENTRFAAEMEMAKVESERVAAVAEAAAVAEQEGLLAAKAEEEIEAAVRLEEERLAEAAEAARVQSEQLLVEQQRLAAAEEEEANRLKLERLAAAERVEKERQLAEEIEAARVDAERLEQERLEADAELAETIEQERLDVAHEAMRLEDERLEKERIALEDAERERLEREKIAHERLAAERAMKAELISRDMERIEQERILTEETEMQQLETDILQDEKLSIVSDENVDVVPCDELGRYDAMANQNDQTHAVSEGGENDELVGINCDDLDDMYDDDDSDDEPDADRGDIMIEIKTVTNDNTEIDQNCHDLHAPLDQKPVDNPEQKDIGGSVVEPPIVESSFFDAAAAATSMFQSSNIFDVSKSSSMFSSWGGSNISDTVEIVTPVGEKSIDSITESTTGNTGEVIEDISTQQQQQLVMKTELDELQNVPQHMLDRFMHQLERVTENHQLELDELQRTHILEMEQLKTELQNERDTKKKSSAKDDVAAQDKFLKQMRDLEKKFAGTIKDQESELRDVKQRNGEMESKINSLNRDVSKLTKTIADRDEEIDRLKQGYGNTMMQVEGQVKNRTEEIYKKDAEINSLKQSVSTLRTELDTTTDAYNTLKGRAKAVASELKDRRIEVRTLTSQNEELTSSNASLETQLGNLRSVVNRHELTIVYKDNDMEALNEKIKELSKEIEKGKVAGLQDRSVGEMAIASYKRKAQEALAAANARLATANQSREEAESDAKLARSASDDAVERARIAEMKRSEAELQASKATSELESERMALSKHVTELKEDVERLQDMLSSTQAEMENVTSTRKELVAEVEQLTSDLSVQKEKNADLRDHLIQTNTLCESLQKEVNDLNEEVQRSSAVAFKRAKDNGETSNAENHVESRSNAFASSIDRHEADGTIIMLQQELQGANEAIAELKLALRTAILERIDNNDYARDKAVSAGISGMHIDTGGGGGAETNNGNESTPLFFAIEKQNELKTARDEINRLANMLGDAESSKQDAVDAMEGMRQKMEEANSRLLRYEKLGMNSSAGTRPPVSHNTSYGPFRSNAPSSVNDSAVNLEYLKNIMLSFLTATTYADRRKLVPVVATVLCLTPEEQAQAINSVEATAGLGGVASSFWENIGSRAHNVTGR